MFVALRDMLGIKNWIHN